MTFMPRYVLPDLESPPPIGDRYGLVTAALGPLAMPLKAQGGGISYYPMSCGSTRDYPVVCGPDDSPGESPGDDFKTFDFGTPFTEGDPFAIYSTIQCGSAGLAALAPDAVATLRRRLELRFMNGRQTGIERGASAALASSGAPELVVPDPTNIVSVVSTLEQWLYGQQSMTTTGLPSDGLGYGKRGYLHTTPRISAWAAREHLIEPDGPNRWKTPMGTVWVWGGGYSGALPGAAAAVAGTDAIYITGQTVVWEGPDPAIQPDLEQTFDREANQWMALWEQLYMVTFECGVAAAPFEYGSVSP